MRGLCLEQLNYFPQQNFMSLEELSVPLQVRK